MTLTDFLVLLVSLMVFRPQPKTGLPPKKRRKPIPTRARRSRRDNPFKSQYRRHTEEQSSAWANEKRAENIAKQSDARDACCAALRASGIRHRIEEVICAYGNFYFADVWLPDHKVWFECDGAGHKAQKDYDHGRDEDIAAVTGFRVIRRWNGWYLRPGLQERILIELGR